MRIRFISTVAAAIFGICQVVSPSHASTMTWHLLDVTFVGGGTATGSFDLDFAASTISNVSIDTSHAHYTDVGLVDVYATNLAFVVLSPDTATANYAIFLAFSSFLPSTGGTVPLIPLQGSISNSTEFNLQTGYRFDVSSGFVTATPLPAAFPLFATGIGALGLLGWRRKRRQLSAKS